MGDRGHIVVEQYGDNDPVVLYAHWRASELPAILATALSHQERWDDPGYLARIIFDELTDHAGDFTGAGIGTEIHGDVWRVIRVDPNNKEVIFEDPNDYDRDEYSGNKYSFERFVDIFAEQIDA